MKTKKSRPARTAQERKTRSPNSNTPVLSKRQIRLARALLRGPVTRERADRIAPASNAPDVVMGLRRKLNVVLYCERVPFVTIDGRPSWYGKYHASARDRRKLERALGV